MTGDLIRKGQRHRGRMATWRQTDTERMPCEEASKDWSDASKDWSDASKDWSDALTSQGPPRMSAISRS